MAFLVATTSLPAVYRYARTATAGTPHARANISTFIITNIFNIKKTSENKFFYFHVPKSLQIGGWALEPPNLAVG